MYPSLGTPAVERTYEMCRKDTSRLGFEPLVAASLTYWFKEPQRGRQGLITC